MRVSVFEHGSQNNLVILEKSNKATMWSSDESEQAKNVSKIIEGSGPIKKTVVNKNQLFILSGSGEVYRFDYRPKNWNNPIYKKIKTQFVSDIDIDYNSEKGNPVCLVNDKLILDDGVVQLRPSIEIVAIYTTKLGTLCLNNAGGLFLVNSSGMPEMIFSEVTKVRKSINYIYVISGGTVYMLNIKNPNEIKEIEGLYGLKDASDDLVLFDNGHVGMLINNKLGDVYKFPDRITGIDSVRGSYYAEGEAGRVFVWGSNIDNRLGISEHEVGIYVDDPTFNPFI